MNPLDEKILTKRCLYQNANRAEAGVRYERFLADKHGIYPIKTNDTLPEIAERFEVSVDDLVLWNKIEDPAIIYFGSCLFVRTPKCQH